MKTAIQQEQHVSKLSKSDRPFDADGGFVHPRYRDFYVAIKGATVLNYGGIDLKPEDVLRQREAVLRAEFQGAKGQQHPSTFVGWWGDEVLWEGNDVVAVLMPRHLMDAAARIKGSEVDFVVYRMDSKLGTRRPGRVWDGTDDEKSARIRGTEEEEAKGAIIDDDDEEDDEADDDEG
jgi:hypothetical protein